MMDASWALPLGVRSGARWGLQKGGSWDYPMGGRLGVQKVVRLGVQKVVRWDCLMDGCSDVHSGDQKVLRMVGLRDALKAWHLVEL